MILSKNLHRLLGIMLYESKAAQHKG